MTINATDTTFEQEVLNSDIPVIVDFWAPWCGPCKTVGPIFESLASGFEGKVKFVKVNIDETGIASKYGVRGIPTLSVFKQGNVVGTMVGAQPKTKIEEFVNTYA